MRIKINDHFILEKYELEFDVQRTMLLLIQRPFNCFGKIEEDLCWPVRLFLFYIEITDYLLTDILEHNSITYGETVFTPIRCPISNLFGDIGERIKNKNAMMKIYFVFFKKGISVIDNIRCDGFVFRQENHIHIFPKHIEISTEGMFMRFQWLAEKIDFILGKAHE